MAGLLTDTLQLWAEQPFHPRTANCVLSVTDYVEAALDRRANPRPHDLAPVACLKLWQDERALQVFCEDLFNGLGLSVLLTEPRRGDVGLVHGLGPSLTAAICLAPGKWAGRSERGLVASSATPLVAWAMPEGAA